ncbi:MAG: phytanoyl-CoA dioxygenase family protein [Deltaproteobacteria bacterium]|nr:phytanoyl-CoA dioxygenase family protein [Deltaproteobacteria bacterium]
MLTGERRSAWERDGFFIVGGFADSEVGDAMHARAVELARQAGGAGRAGPSLVQPEARTNPNARQPEDCVSKIFNLHREEAVFRSFIQDERVLDGVAGLIGPDLDCFLSQFIFKNPGALGQPWHQDSFYFRFDRTPQVGLWLAVTEATIENGCLHVVPGSHREPVHTHVPDRRPGANYGYVEIVDHDMSSSIPVEMQPGDLLVFHSHLMHRSTSNESSGLRAAMVYHLAEAGTVDRDEKPAAINDWFPVRRNIEPVNGARRSRHEAGS